MKYEDLKELLSQLGVSTKLSGNNLVGKCPFHQESKPSWGISINEPHLYNCFGCVAKGSIVELLVHLGVDSAKAKELSGEFEIEGKLLPTIGETGNKRPEDDPEYVSPSDRATMFETFKSALDFKISRKYLHGRGLTDETICSADLRFHRRHKRILFPWWISGRLMAVTGRAVESDQEKIVSYFGGKKLDIVYCPGWVPGLTGACITEGEISALAMRQLRPEWNALALGRGNTSPAQLRCLLSFPAKKFFLTTDWDQHGNSLRAELALELGKSAVVVDLRVVHPFPDGFKDPADFLQSGRKMFQYVTPQPVFING